MSKPVARKNDPHTSHEAAASVSKVSETQRAILKILTIAMTDDELIDQYWQASDAWIAPYASVSGVRSRRAELVRLGLVEDTGDRVKTRVGRNAIVWRTTLVGIEWMV